MLKYFYTLFFTITVMSNSFAQDFNYAVMTRKNIVYLNNDIGYSRLINPKLILTSRLGVTLESGKIKIIRTPREGSISLGGHYLILNKSNWKTATALELTSNYYNLPSITDLSFSSNLTVIGGYYTSTWLFAGEIGMFVPVISKLKFDRINYGVKTKKSPFSNKIFSSTYFDITDLSK